MSLLENVARAFADEPASDRPRTLTRREVASRGLLGLLALVGLRELGFPGSASAAQPRCTSLGPCLSSVEKAAQDAYRKCSATTYQGPFDYLDNFDTLGCRLWAWEPARKEGYRSCIKKCPPPKASTPKRRHPRAPKRQPTPPPLPPNPYDAIADECANCRKVGGECCYGGDPKHLCACANASIPCERYGCSS
jgi:hypothetical protein